MSEADPIADFWSWWPTEAAAIAEGFRSKSGLSKEVVDKISALVTAIEPSLDWEFGPGKKSEHHLCLSGKGDPALRVVAERWKRRAPKDDEVWEFYAARQGGHAVGMSLEFGGHKLSFDDLAFAVDPEDAREIVHLTAFHEAFASMPDAKMRMRVVFIALDNLLGEDGVERWVGRVELAETKPENALGLAALDTFVSEFAAKATGERWMVLKGTRDGAPIFLTTNAALKRVDHLLMDTHLSVTIAIDAPTEQGFPTNEEADALNAIEDALTEALAKDAVYIGRETTRGVRSLHFHVLESGPAAAIVERWRGRFPARSIDVAFARDLRWDVLRRFR